MSGQGRDNFPEVASQVPFDNDNNGFDSDNVQGALEEIGISASPGFSWGRSGNLSNNTWLQNDGVSSNRAGRAVIFADPTIIRIFTATEDLNTYTITIYEHEGDSINLTALTTLSSIASRTADSGVVEIAVTVGRQLAIRITSGSAKNIVVGLQLTGKNT
jgi:hypothetical protein